MRPSSRGARFGVQVVGQYPLGLPVPPFFRSIAGLAEELGFDSIWAGEHLSFHNATLEGMVSVSFLAACTQRVAVGTGVLLLPLRHPGLVAKQVASLDVLAGGRLVLGIGVGGEGPADFRAVQVAVSERGSRADEAIDVMRLLWSGQPVSHRGAHFSIEDVSMQPTPVRPGGPPLWVGGRSAKALARAAKYGDGWLAAFMSPSGYARASEALDESAEGVGRRPGDITRAHYLHTLVDSSGFARHRAVQLMSARYGRPFDDPLVDRYCLVGNPGECMAGIERFVDAGVEHLVFVPIADHDELHDQLTVLWGDVLVPSGQLTTE